MSTAEIEYLTQRLNNLINPKKTKNRRMACKHPDNEILVDELRVIMEQSAIRGAENLTRIYRRAIASIKCQTKQIRSGEEAKELKGIGSFIAAKIDMILKKNRPSTSIISNKSTSLTHSNESAGSVDKLAMENKSEKCSSILNINDTQSQEIIKSLGDYEVFSSRKALESIQIHTLMGSLGYTWRYSTLSECLENLLNKHNVLNITKSKPIRYYLNESGKSIWIYINQNHDKIQRKERVNKDDETISLSTISHSSSSQAPTLSSASVTSTPECIVIDSSENEEENDVLSFENRTKNSIKHVNYVNGEKENISQNTSSSASSINDEYCLDPDRLKEIQNQIKLNLFRRIEQVKEVNAKYSTLNDHHQPNDEYEVVLILDTREQIDKRNRDAIHAKLAEFDITYETRALSIGDIFWIVRRYRTLQGKEYMEEFVLDSIVERKTVNDLASSIMDRRYKEQKTRLAKSGVKNVIYIVEGSLSSRTTLRGNGIQASLTSTIINDDFFVKHTRSIDETLRFLQRVHISLIRKFPKSSVRNIEEAMEYQYCEWIPSFHSIPCRTYQSFQDEYKKSKDLSTDEIYRMMLTQIPGVSISKADAISKQYPTFRRFYEAYRHEMNQKNQKEMIQDIKFGTNQRRIGPSTSHRVADVMTKSRYH